MEVAASFATVEQRAEDVPQQRLGDPFAAVGTTRAECRDVTARRVLLRVGPCEQVAGNDRPVPREQRQLLVKPRRVDEPLPELFGRLPPLAPMVGEVCASRLRVVPDLADLLRTPAGPGDLGRPGEGLVV